MAEEVKRKYTCSEDALYEITRRTIASLEHDLADFFAKSTNYTLLYVNMVKGLRTTAMALPNEDQRNATHEATRNLLPGLIEPIKANYKTLQGFIRDGWPTEEPNPRYEEAGLLKYNAIRQSNWEAVVGLQQMMLDFVAVPANLAKLTSPGGMPAGFVAQLGTDYAPFDTAYTLFGNTIDTTTARNAKVTANNALTLECKKFMKFGVESVYRNNSGQQDLYTWSKIEEQVDGGMAGIHLLAMNGEADVPEAEVECTWKPDGKEAVTWLTAKTGVGVQMLEAGEGVLTVKKKGIHMISKRFEIDPGVKKQVQAIVMPETSPTLGEIVLGRGTRPVVNKP